MTDHLSEYDQQTYDRLSEKRIRLSQAQRRLTQVQQEVQRLQSVEAAWMEFHDHVSETYSLKEGDYIRDNGDIVRAVPD